MLYSFFLLVQPSFKKKKKEAEREALTLTDCSDENQAANKWVAGIIWSIYSQEDENLVWEAMQDAPRSKDRGNKSLQEAENEEQNARITTCKHQNAIFIFRT